MEKKFLDLILVPSGLLLMLVYHLWLFYRIMKHPTKTVIGVNAINRRFWVQAMMEVCAHVLLTMPAQKLRFLFWVSLVSTIVFLGSNQYSMFWEHHS